MNYTASDSFSQNVLSEGIDVGNAGVVNAVTLTLPAGKTCQFCQVQWMWESTADNGSSCLCVRVLGSIAPIAQASISRAPTFKSCVKASSTARRTRSGAATSKTTRNVSACIELTLPHDTVIATRPSGPGLPSEDTAHKAYSGVALGLAFLLAGGLGLGAANYWFRRRPGASGGASGGAKAASASSAPKAQPAVSAPAASPAKAQPLVRRLLVARCSRPRWLTRVRRVAMSSIRRRSRRSRPPAQPRRRRLCSRSPSCRPTGRWCSPRRAPTSTTK